MKKDEIFVAAISREVFEKTIERYKLNLSGAVDSKGVFGVVGEVLDKLNEDDKELFFRFLQIVAFDVLSQLLANLDGTSFNLGFKGDFTLLYEGVEIQGGLQELLVGEAELRKVFERI